MSSAAHGYVCATFYLAISIASCCGVADGRHGIDHMVMLQAASCVNAATPMQLCRQPAALISCFFVISLAVLEVFLSIRCLPVTRACADEFWWFGASAVQLW